MARQEMAQQEPAAWFALVTDDDTPEIQIPLYDDGDGAVRARNPLPAVGAGESFTVEWTDSLGPG
jgi:hypothetical protein